MSRAKSPSTGQTLPAWAAALGQRLRSTRTDRKLSLATVSEATGISTSFLSLLEHGRTDVGLGRLLSLLGFYGMELSDVLADRAGPETQVVRRADRPVVFSPADGIDVFLASRDRQRAFVPLVVEFAPGSAMTSWSRHEAEEFLLVLSGRIKIEFTDDAPTVLELGDSLFISGERGHRLRALGDDRAQALIVTTSHVQTP